MYSISRTRYENTIYNLEKVFNKEYIFYSLYENLFNLETFSRLKIFLNISDLDFEKDKIIFETPKQKNQSSLSDELKKEIFQFYRSTYLFCDKRFNSGLIWDKNH